jgi:hypothetical protein
MRLRIRGLGSVLILLECYGLKGDPVDHLKQSMETWKGYCGRLAAGETRPE